MFCGYCGNKIDDETLENCPYCGHTLIKTNLNQKNISINYSNNNLDNIEEEKLLQLRNQLGYLNIGTKWWHHLIIAIGGYLGMDIIASIIISIIIKINSGLDEEKLLNLANTASAITQVVLELAVVGILAIIFRKHLKKFFNTLANRQTWKWIGIGFAIAYGGPMIYNIILNALGLLSDSSSSNQEAVNSIIFSTPFLGFIFVVIAAPLFEEIIFRFGIFRTFSFKDKKMEIIGFVVTTLVFAGMHMLATFEEFVPTLAAGEPDWALLKNDFLTFPIYIIGAFALTFVYYKSKTLAASMMTHMIYNGISFLLILITSFLLPVEEVIKIGFTFLTRLLF